MNRNVYLKRNQRQVWVTVATVALLAAALLIVWALFQ